MEGSGNNGIALIRERLSALETQVKAILTEQERLRTGVNGLNTSKYEVAGAWMAIKRIAAALVVVIAGAGGLIAAVGWLLEHHIEFVVH